MKKALVFGAGNIGRALIEQLAREHVPIVGIVRTAGVFDLRGNKLAHQSDWKNYAAKADCAFICVPTAGTGEEAFEYARAFLGKNKPVITCEKASVAHHWNELKLYKNIFKYTATVGGGTKMLKEISKYKPEEIVEIKAVVNGTLNYVAHGLKEGKPKDEVAREVLEKGYAEPGAETFGDMVKGELKDVVLKTIIMANHSGMFEKPVGEGGIAVTDFADGKRCVVLITREKIQAGFLEDGESAWLPDGVNNVLYINGEKKVYGPGAGAEATVSAMMEDYRLFEN